MIDKKISSREAIMEAGFALFSKDPSVSLADIAAHANVGRATLHRHFSGRDDLMVALAHQALEELDAAVTLATQDADSYTDALRLTMQAVLPLARRQKFLAEERVVEDALAAQYAEAEALVRDMMVQAQNEGTLNPNIEPDWLTAVYNNLIYAGWEMVDAEEATPKQASAFIWQVFSKGASA